MNLEPIRRLENYLLRRDQLRRRKVARQSLRRQCLHVCPIQGSSERQERLLGCRVKECDPSAVVVQNRIHFNALACGDLLRSAAIRIYSPQMTSIDIVLVSRKYQEG